MSEIIYGRNAVLEAIKSGQGIESVLIQKGIEGSGKVIYAEAKKRDLKITSVNKDVLDNKTQSGGHQGVMAYMSDFVYSSIDDIIAVAAEREERPFIVLLDGIEDPHNLGAIIRSAEGAGVHGIIIPKNRSASVTDTVVKVSAGASMYMKVARVTSTPKAIDELKDKGFWIYGLDMDGQSYKEVKIDTAVGLVIGSEGNGMSRIVREKCDFVLSIPMRGKVSSLNASNAAAIVMYELLS
ncbi:MAG: 23S rRNA (guanosine(2251)-2'-O)-methyltransferase RlmB [Clostridiales Family XIII bacterium]|jgi:23S rRNA (guanosine2251-2'-O)-methyltransferase|nr:23S rRNA (guanosine(2251)-2'-O)-methyltransferase RlmB [Clostridiales Family XIII bacterium]